MQGSNAWTPPGGVLGELIASTRARVATLAPRSAELQSAAAASPKPPSFVEALKGHTVSVIAEVKRASPSKGDINPGLDVASQCRAYESGGADAISVLTEPSRFGGDISDLAEARKATARPLLRKDFIVDEIQISEARAAGASAVLLIARALDPSRLEWLFRAAIENGVDALVEVRDERELDRALGIGARVIGVNNRNLETLEVDDAALALIPKIPSGCIAIAESGYRTVDDVRRAADAGADAVLIGSELSSSISPASLVQRLSSIPRCRNARPN